MLFNSIDFAFFLPIVFLLYWFVFKELKIQNAFLLITSYVFYGWWDWRFLFLIVFSSFIDFFIGILISNSTNKNKRKLLLFISIAVNLGFLGFFKYFNFFTENFSNAFSLFGNQISISSLEIVLPVGISFYTFQTLSYTIDIYRNKLTATKNITAFFSFISFFPQLVAGPIERASNLLPQFYKKRKFDYAKAGDGMQQILWGLFKKIVIADNCAVYANDIFNNYSNFSGVTLFLAAVFFSFQIYCDFSGYSDIAIGTSRLFGFNLKRNFSFPYFSRDIAEFWRKWHISLSTWFRDYLYIPLGGSRGTVLNKIKNVFIIFIVSGFWHGGKWTFILWGGLNALYFLPMMLLNRNRHHLNSVAEGRILPSFKELVLMMVTFFFVVIAWIFFRADNTVEAFSIIATIFNDALTTSSYIEAYNYIYWKALALTLLIVFFMLIEWIHRTKEFGLQLNNELPVYVKWISYYLILILILFYRGEQQEFIYFQF